MIYEALYKLYITTALKNGITDIISYEDFKKTTAEVYELTYKKYYPDLDLEKSNVADFEGKTDAETIIQYVVSHHCNKLKKDNSFCRPHKEQIARKPYFAGKRYACIAPYRTLRFEFNGNMTVCCANKYHVIGTYPENSPKEAWEGNQLAMLRRAVANYDFHLGCQTCMHQILIGNEMNTMMEAANSQDELLNSKKACVQSEKKYPADLTFQLQNNCNYECIMCSGEYSSSICKNRDGKLPPPSVYDDTYIEKITPFLQHAESCNFLGGEPFLIPIYYKMWDIIRDINPNCAVNITSNGSIYTKRIEDMLSNLPNARIIISLDSLVPETYAYIRRRGDLNVVLNNIEKFLATKKLTSLAVCPIIQNVYEIPNFVKFCAKRNINIWFNNVTDIISDNDTYHYKDLYENGIAENTNKVVYNEDRINEFRLWTLPQKEKIKIKNELCSHSYPLEYQTKVTSFINFLLNYSRDTAPKE